MKKILSVIILLAFVGTTIVMTGCLGGDDGVGIAIAAFTIAIVASSGGSAATAAFAANQRPALRPAIASTSTNISMRVLALDDAGTTQKTYEIKNNQLTWNDQTNGIDTIESNFQPNDSYNQYRVQVIYNGNVILEGMDFYKTSERGPNLKETINVTATSTAKVMVYDKWNTSGTERNYDLFNDNLSTTDLDFKALVASITTNLGSDTYGVDYSSIVNNVSLPTETTAKFDVTGYVTAADGSGSTGTMVYAYDANDTERNNMISHGYSENGEFTLLLENGTYVLVPSNEGHVFTPSETNVTVDNDDLANVNFQATRAQATAASNR
jgi:hypothetical protein